jgi:hypothetical protein
MYTTDLQSLFSLLSGSEQSGTLTLHPDTSPSAWQVRFTLVRGQPTVCVATALSMAPVRIAPEQAIAELSADLNKRGMLQWTFEHASEEYKEKQEDNAPGIVFNNALPAPFPQRNAAGMEQPWRPWDRPYRMKTNSLSSSQWERLPRSIFGLIDNQRTVQNIAELLHKSLEEMQHPLQVLYRSGCIGRL